MYEAMMKSDSYLEGYNYNPVAPLPFMRIAEWQKHPSLKEGSESNGFFSRKLFSDGSIPTVSLSVAIKINLKINFI